MREDHDGGTAYYVDDKGIHFTEEGLRHFTEEERNRLNDLHKQHAEKFDEICDHLAKSFGPKETLSTEQKAAIFEEAEELADRWDDEVEGVPEDLKQAKKSITADPELQVLLAAHWVLGDSIMDIRDMAVERDPYTKALKFGGEVGADEDETA
jgi:hypothetical protein